jgi:nucleoside triphosphate diphosphatase
MTPSHDIARLIEIMAALRTPGTGCPWDLEQDFSTIAPYTIEEAYEVADAIARGDFDDLRDELGDLLLQVAFHARMAEEAGRFAFGDVVEAITGKLVRRHPHVFGDGSFGDLSGDRSIGGPSLGGRSSGDPSFAGPSFGNPSDQARPLPTQAVNALWDRIKAEEKAARAARRGAAEQIASALDGVPAALPALTRALKLQEKAGKVGFDCNDPLAVLAKIREETDEIAAALASGKRRDAAAETGDLLFAVVNLARHLGADPEAALRATNVKFERRFGFIERALAAQGNAPAQSSLAEMDALWNAAKKAEKDAGNAG